MARRRDFTAVVFHPGHDETETAVIHPRGFSQMKMFNPYDPETDDNLLALQAYDRQTRDDYDSLEEDNSDAESSENSYEVPRSLVGLVKRITPGSRRQSTVTELHKPKERRYAKTIWPNAEKVPERRNGSAVATKLDSAASTLDRSVEYDMEKRGALMNSIRSGVKLKAVKPPAPLIINRENLVNPQDDMNELDGGMEDINTPLFEKGIIHQSSMDESKNLSGGANQEPDLTISYKDIPIKPKHQSTPLPEIPKVSPHYSISSKGVLKKQPSVNGTIMLEESKSSDLSSLDSFPGDKSDLPLLPKENNTSDIQKSPEPVLITNGHCDSDDDIYFKNSDEDQQKNDENANEPIKLDVPDKGETAHGADDEDHIYSPVANQSSTGTHSYGDPAEPQGLYSEVDDANKHHQDEDNIYEAYEPVSFAETNSKPELHIKPPLLDVSSTSSPLDEEDLEKPLLPPRNLKPMSPNISKRKLPPPPPSPDMRSDSKDTYSINPPALPKRTYSRQSSKNSHSSPPDSPAPDRPKWATTDPSKENVMRQRLFNQSMPNFKRPLKQKPSDGYIQPVDTERPRSMTDLQSVYSNQVAMSRLKDNDQRKTKTADNFLETATFAASERLKSNERRTKKKYKILSKEKNNQEVGFKLHFKIITEFEQMLQDDPEKFSLSLGRAVRTNNIAAVKVLCSILKKDNIKHSAFGEQKRHKLTDVIFSEYGTGATLLHLALMYNHTDICDHLIAFGGRDLIMARYTSEKYSNQTTLHVAVANKNIVAIRALLKPLELKDRIDLMNTNATGSFFKRQHIDGQTCLTSALWAGSSDIVAFLVKEGANLTNTNMRGENILHRIVHQSIMFPERDYTETLSILQSLSGLFGCRRIAQDTTFEGPIYEHAKKKIFLNLLGTRSADGYTPLSLAAKLKSKLLKEFLSLDDIYKMRQINLGSSAWVTYDVTDVLSRRDGSYNKYSCLHIAAHDSSPADINSQLQEDALDIEPLSQVFKLKWNVFKWVLMAWFLVHLTFMICFTLFAIQPPMFTDNSTNVQPFHTKNNLTTVSNSAIRINIQTNVTSSPQYEQIVKRDVGGLSNHTLDTYQTDSEHTSDNSTIELSNTTQVSLDATSIAVNATSTANATSSRTSTTSSTTISTTSTTTTTSTDPSTTVPKTSSTTTPTISTTTTLSSTIPYITNEPSSTVHTTTKVPDDGTIANDEADSRNRSGLVFGLFLILPCIYLMLEILDIYSLFYFNWKCSDQNFGSCAISLLKSIWTDWSVTGNGPYRMLAVLFSTCVISWFMLYRFERTDQDLPLAGALLFGWLFSVYFTKACPVLSKFSLIVQKIFFQDILYFVTLYIFIWLAFSFAFHSLVVESPIELSISNMFYMIYVITDLNVKYSDHFIGDINFVRVLLTIYALVSLLLLINLLISILSTSYKILKPSHCGLVKRQQLSQMLMIERRLIWCKPLCDYSEHGIYKHDKRYYIEVHQL